MLLATYVGIRPGIQGLGNIGIRIRLDSKCTHSEVVFEPTDRVDHLMPDGTTQPDENGALWCASSVFAERLPKFSPHRANRIGGVRFKRINTNSDKWVCQKLPKDPEQIAKWFVLNQGVKYDHRLIMKYALWLLPGNDPDRVMCSESIAKAMGVPEAERIDPAILDNIVTYLNMVGGKNEAR